MFEVLAAEIGGLEIPPSCAAVTEVALLSSALRAKVTMALAEVDLGGEWAVDGSATMAAWIRIHLGVTHTEAGRLLKVGRRLRMLPVTRAAWLAGDLTDGQVDVVVANVTNRRAPLFAEHEAVLVPDLVGLDLQDTRNGLQRWAALADAILDGDEPPEEPPAEVQLVPTLDGRSYLRGSFDEEGGEVIATGLRLAGSNDWELSAAQRNGQAMLDVFRFYLDHQTDKLGKRHRPHLNVVIREAVKRPGFRDRSGYWVIGSGAGVV